MIHKKEAGFTLIELSVVLIIIGFLIGGGLQLQNKKLDSDRAELTHKRIEFVMEALDQFVDFYGYLPCPAPPEARLTTVAGDKTDFGIGHATYTAGASATDPTTTNGVCDGANLVAAGANSYLGAIPVHTLNIHPSYSVDGWNRRLLYFVDQKMTIRGNAQTTAPSGVGKVFERGTLLNTGNPWSYTSGNNDGVSNNSDVQGLFEIWNQVGTTAIHDNGVVVVMSAGFNGFEAWPGRGGARLVSALDSAEEQENTDNDNQYRQTFLSPNSDDILYYTTKWKLDAEREF